MRTVYILIIILGTILSCQNSEAPLEQATLGMACGICNGQCFQGFRISKDRVLKLSAPYFDELEKASTAPASPAEANAARQLLSLLPKGLEKYPDKIGCPDCADQCAIYISTQSSGRTKTIVIDPNEHPVEFDSFVARVKALQLL